MSNSRRWIIIFLSLCALVLIGWNLSERKNSASIVQKDTNAPTFSSQHNETFVYNPAGKLNYTLVSSDAQYYNDTQLTWFTHPVMTLLDEQIKPSWSVSADRAKLTKDHLLYLYGNVVVKSLTPDSQLEKITTDNAVINLVTQDVSSDNQVTLYGTNFRSDGMKMRGNLRTKTAELIDKVKSSYEIQTQPQHP